MHTVCCATLLHQLAAAPPCAPPPIHTQTHKNRGALATPADKAAVDELVRSLEAVSWSSSTAARSGCSRDSNGSGGGSSASNKTELLNGRWELLYANTEPFRNSPFFGAFSNVVSGLVADDGYLADGAWDCTIPKTPWNIVILWA